MNIKKAVMLPNGSFVLQVETESETFSYTLTLTDQYGLAPELRDLLETQLQNGSVIPEVFRPSAKASILGAPKLGFGGPSMKDLLNGNI